MNCLVDVRDASRAFVSGNFTGKHLYTFMAMLSLLQYLKGAMYACNVLVLINNESSQSWYCNSMYACLCKFHLAETTKSEPYTFWNQAVIFCWTSQSGSALYQPVGWVEVERPNLHFLMRPHFQVWLSIVLVSFAE